MSANEGRIDESGILRVKSARGGPLGVRRGVCNSMSTSSISGVLRCYNVDLNAVLSVYLFGLCLERHVARS